MPASASAPAVPPVDTSSTPSSASPLAKSTMPVLSETDNSARRTWTSPGAVSGSVWAISVPTVMRARGYLRLRQHAPRVGRVDPHRPARDQADRLRQQLVLDGVEPLEDVLARARVR